ncbi:MAG: hypothetical protein ACP5P7_05020 [Sulfurihydrogenibium sp.]
MDCKVKTYSNSLDCLVSYLSNPVRLALSKYPNLIVSQTFRNSIYQAFLYWASRSEDLHLKYASMLGLKSIFKRGKHLTYTLRSLHCIFSAVDLYFVDKDKKIINDVALYQELYGFLLDNSKIGLSWGGFYKNRDLGHFELAMSDILKEQLFTMQYSNVEYVEKHIESYLKKAKAKKNIEISKTKSEV